MVKKSLNGEYMYKKFIMVLTFLAVILISASAVSASNDTVNDTNNAVTAQTSIAPVTSVQTSYVSGIKITSTASPTPVKITIINKATGGNIRKNTLLMKYIKKTALSNLIISKAKSGTPMVTFGNGKGPKIMIVAGVHGNELPASAAAMKLINYLNGKTIMGTIYIVPFLIPYNTAHKYRYWHGKNPNSIANVRGSPTNVIVNLAKKLKVNVVGDFHSTKPGGVPGRKSVFCSILPTKKSYSIAYYISKKTGSSLIAYKQSGKDYPGALEDVTNLSGIPAVTCEVVSSHRTINTTKVNNSFNQMIALLKYFKIL